MIIGECPYDDCGESLMIPIYDSPPQWERHECEHCHGVIWTRYSRVDPYSLTEVDFLLKHHVDHTAKVIYDLDKIEREYGGPW